MISHQTLESDPKTTMQDVEGDGTTRNEKGAPKVHHDSAWTHHFKYGGRRYTLFKREPSKDAAWYIHLKHAGRRHKKSLETNNAASAVDRAKHFIDLVRDAKWSDLSKLQARRSVSTIGEVLAVYRRLATVKAETARNNASAIARIITRATTPPPASVDSLPLTALTPQLLRSYSAAATAGHTGASLETARRSVNSHFAQARSIFARHLLTHYTDAGLTLPDLAAFLAEPGFRGLRARTYSATPDTVLAATFTSLEGMATADPNLYRAVWLAVGCGLRKSEIINTRWSHITTRAGAPYLRTEHIGKDREIVEAPMMTDAWTALLRAPGSAPDAFILEGDYRERHHLVWSRISAWMTSLGWTTQKKIHEFRAYVGSKIAEKHGLIAAQQFLRHKDFKTTQDHYMRYLQLTNINVPLTPTKP